MSSSWAGLIPTSEKAASFSDTWSSRALTCSRNTTVSVQVQRRDGVWLKSSTEDWFSAHLSVVVLKVAQFETLLQFGLMSHPELIESPFCLIQLRQQSDRGAETETEMKRDGKKKRTGSKHSGGQGGGVNKELNAGMMLTEVLGSFCLSVFLHVRGVYN